MEKLMLLKEVSGLGEAGDVVRVKSGYARNYLLPRRLAAPVSADAMKQAEAHKRRRAAEIAKRKEEAKAQIDALNAMSVSVEARAQEDSSLYGSVTAHMIAEAIVKEGVAVEDKHIHLAEPIKALGIYDVTVRLFEGVEASVKLYVVEPPPPPGSAPAESTEAAE